MTRKIGILFTVLFLTTVSTAHAEEAKTDETKKYSLLSPSESQRLEMMEPAKGLKLGYTPGSGLDISSEDGKFSLNFSSTIATGYGYRWTEGVRTPNENTMSLDYVGVSLGGKYHKSKSSLEFISGDVPKRFREGSTQLPLHAGAYGGHG